MFSAYSFVYSCLFVSILRSEHRPHARKSLRAYVKQGIHSDQHRCPCKASRRLVEQAKNKKQTGKHGCHSQAILRARRRQMSAVCSWNAACLFTPHGGTHIHHRSRVHCSKDKFVYTCGMPTRSSRPRRSFRRLPHVSCTLHHLFLSFHYFLGSYCACAYHWVYITRGSRRSPRAPFDNQRPHPVEFITNSG